MTKSIVKSRFVYDYLRDPSAVLGSAIVVLFILASLLAS
jgi:hypothetical protein